MTVRSGRIGGPAQITSGGTSFSYTVPSGKTLIVKWLTLYASGGACATGAFIGSVSTAHLVGLETVGAGVLVQRSVWWIVEAGEDFKISNDGPGALTYSAHGALLDGPAGV